MRAETLIFRGDEITLCDIARLNEMIDIYEENKARIQEAIERQRDKQ